VTVSVVFRLWPYFVDNGRMYPNVVIRLIANAVHMHKQICCLVYLKTTENLQVFPISLHGEPRHPASVLVLLPHTGYEARFPSNIHIMHVQSSSCRSLIVHLRFNSRSFSHSTAVRTQRGFASKSSLIRGLPIRIRRHTSSNPTAVMSEFTRRPLDYSDKAKKTAMVPRPSSRYIQIIREILCNNLIKTASSSSLLQIKSSSYTE